MPYKLISVGPKALKFEEKNWFIVIDYNHRLWVTRSEFFKFYVFGPNEINLYDIAYVKVDIIVLQKIYNHTHFRKVWLNYAFCTMCSTLVDVAELKIYKSSKFPWSSIKSSQATEIWIFNLKLHLITFYALHSGRGESGLLVLCIVLRVSGFSFTVYYIW